MVKEDVGGKTFRLSGEAFLLRIASPLSIARQPGRLPEQRQILFVPKVVYIDHIVAPNQSLPLPSPIVVKAFEEVDWMADADD